MIVVGGGSSTRFGADKLMTPVAGRPLLAHTISAVAPHVQRCVVVVRADQMERVADLGLGVELVAGGATRTTSEMAGLAAVGDSAELVGIHDGARPAVSARLVNSLFELAEASGSAVPVLDPRRAIIDREMLSVVPSLCVAQTPQVFRSDLLMEAYVRAAREGVDARDTAEIVARFTDTRIRTLPGEKENLKVTHPEDLDVVAQILEGRSRI